ncbi:Predicted PurR-regulated permease PerM [Roseomonas rosea]|uniref:Predicted PurR-regulated permease PerM n=1 Tax=Muricoccus roseus TaxID=198092 RepID=A0A1M6Q0Y6_9PROT|nr:AI-2E family transporter [Roseomonas rosea]SHK13915.1 Predicted PurR-regulated permease PerM [Roseomonas rosea]
MSTTSLPEQRPPAQIQPPSSPDLSHLLTVVVGVVTVAGLYLAREVLIPITLAILLSFVLAPVVGGLRRLRVPRVAAVLLSVMLALGIILLIGSIIGVQIASLARDAPRYQSAIQAKAEAAQGSIFGHIEDFSRRLNNEARPHTSPDGPPAAAPAPASPDRNATPGLAPGEDRRPVPVEIRPGESSAFELARKIVSPVLGPLETTFIVFIVAVFVLLQQEDLRDRLIRLFGSNDLHRTTEALDEAGRRLSKYFLAQLMLNGSFGVIVTIGLFFIGVPSPIVWGILAALFRFVPYVGSILAAAFPLMLAAGTEPGWSMVIWTAALFLVTEPLMGQVIEPMVYGHSTGLSPVSVIVAAIFWTWLWGPIGLILATPLTLCLVVLGRHVERLEFLDVMLGDRPALTPVENFYQRMLAGDTDEALAQAETLLQERSLSSYYDEVALKGLRLAANDAERGVLRPEKLERVKNAVTGLVNDLAETPDRDPPQPEDKPPTPPSAAEQALPARPAPAIPVPPRAERAGAWSSERPVLCLAGRGPLDEAASAMLAQILEKHGLGARVVPHEASSRAQVGKLDPTGVAMVCISYLDISGSPAHLRYLLRRLRQRLPGVPLLVGLWPEGEAVLTDASLARAVGADHYTSSLHAAVTACLKVASSGEQTPVAAQAVMERKPLPG